MRSARIWYASRRTFAQHLELAAGAPRLRDARALRARTRLLGRGARLWDGHGVSRRLGPGAHDDRDLRRIRRAPGDRPRLRTQPDRGGRRGHGSRAHERRSKPRTRASSSRARWPKKERRQDPDGHEGLLRRHRRRDDGASRSGGHRRRSGVRRRPRGRRVPGQGRPRSTFPEQG